MRDTLAELLAHQYEASLCTLNLAVVRCPESSWNERVAAWKFCQAAFHAVFFADIYLQPSGRCRCAKAPGVSRRAQGGLSGLRRVGRSRASAVVREAVCPELPPECSPQGA